MIIFGKQPVLHLIETKKELIQKIYLAKEVSKDIFKKFRGFKIERVDFKKAQALAKGGNHQGLLAEIQSPTLTPYQEMLKKEFLLILHSITDIGNIGSIIRTAYSLGVDGIIITGIENFKFDGAVRTSSGAIFDIAIAHNKNIYDILNEAKQKDFQVYGATLNGEDVRQVKFSRKKILVLGSEGEGLPNRVIKSVDKEITIQMVNFDSLNVGVASAILIDRMRTIL